MVMRAYDKYICLLFLGVALSGCELTEMEFKTLESSLVLNPPVFVEPPPPVSSSLCKTDTYYQPDAEIVRKIDILFITDTSGSLSTERPAIVDGIDSFTRQLPSSVDYNAAVMLAHGSKSSWSGRLWQRRSEPKVLKSSEMSIDSMRTQLRYKMESVATDSYSDGGEEGLYSLSRAFDSDRLSEMKQQGFLRDDAALAIVFIADENDICAIYPEGVTRVYDPEKSELPAFTRDCSGISAVSTLAKIKNYQNARPLLISGIVYNNLSQIQPDGENEIAYGYLEMIKLNMGLAIDLAGGHFHEGLGQIGELATKRLHLVTEYTLGQQNIDQSSLRVLIDRNPVSFDYDLTLNKVHLTDYAGIEHSEVLISYCPLVSDESGDSGGGDVDDPIIITPPDESNF